MQKENKVYVINVGQYSDRHVIGVFSDKKIAKEYVAQRDNNCDLDIEEFELNTLIRSDKLACFDVGKTYYQNGANEEFCDWSEYSELDSIKSKIEIESKIEVEELPEEEYLKKDEKNKGLRRFFMGTILAKNKQHALKIMGEYCFQYNVEHPFVWDNPVKIN